MQPRLPDPQTLGAKLEELNADYIQAVRDVLAVYPDYAADPTASGQSELFAEKTASLQKVEADLFLLRDKIEAGIVEAAAEVTKIENSIQEYEGTDKKLAKRLTVLDTQLNSSDGRLRDAVYLYRERYLANCLLAGVVLAGAYHTYKSVFSKVATSAAATVAAKVVK